MSTYMETINLRHRLTQVIILIVAILACMLFSQTAQAQKASKKIRYDHPKYKIAIHKSSHKSCYILYKKRISANKAQLLASNRKGKGKGKLQAESDF